MKKIILIVAALYCAPAFAGEARPLSLLFIGNSYTYYPQSAEKPGLPEVMRKILQSIDSTREIHIDFNTPGGYGLEDHYRNDVTNQLLDRHHDLVFIQAQSMESLELPTLFQQITGKRGVESFRQFLPLVVNRALAANDRVTLFVNWGWNLARHEYLGDKDPGDPTKPNAAIRFPAGHARAGLKFFAETQRGFQEQINQSFHEASEGLPRTTLSFVGSQWLDLADAGVVSYDDLYTQGDWSHPAMLGTYVAALTLVRDGLHEPIDRTTFVPEGINSEIAARIRMFVSSSR